MDFDELERSRLGRRPDLAADLGMDRLDQGALARAPRAPEQRIVGGEPLGEAGGVVEERVPHPVDALEQADGQAIDRHDGQERLRLGLPNEGLRPVEVGLSRRGGRKPLQRPRDPLDQHANRFLEVHGNFV